MNDAEKKTIEKLKKREDDYRDLVKSPRWTFQWEDLSDNEESEWENQ